MLAFLLKPDLYLLSVRIACTALGFLNHETAQRARLRETEIFWFFAWLPPLQAVRGSHRFPEKAGVSVPPSWSSYCQRDAIFQGRDLFGATRELSLNSEAEIQNVLYPDNS